MRLKPLPFFATVAIVSAAILGAGWLWARIAVSMCQKREGATFLKGLPRAAHYEFWSVSVPSKVTANLLVVAAMLSFFVLWRRRDFFSLLALSAYFAILACLWAFLFANLGFEAFV